MQICQHDDRHKINKTNSSEIYHVKGSTTTRPPFLATSGTSIADVRKKQCGYAHFTFGVSYEQWLLDPFSFNVTGD